jgi:predicted oxidoreductase (fatty acid repression mutant protein)
METPVIDTVVENNLIHIPAAFNNKRVKVIIVDLEAKEKKKKAAAKK